MADEEIQASSPLREQRGDAFPEITSQWSDIDGDGWGDNLSSSNRVDNFPLRASQWNDFDGDGFGDNAAPWLLSARCLSKGPEHRQRTMNSVVPTPITTASPTMRTRVRGTPMFPKVLEARRIAPSPPTPNLQSNDDEGVSLLSGDNSTLQLMGGVIIFLLAFIVVAQVARAAGKRKAIAAKQEDRLAQASVAEEENVDGRGFNITSLKETMLKRGHLDGKVPRGCPNGSSSRCSNKPPKMQLFQRC